MHDFLAANKVDGIDPVSHGNAWSVYFLDPEGNRLEFFCDTPWYVAQPRRERLDFSLSDEEIEEATRRSIADDPTTRPENVLSVVTADWNGDGLPDRALLVAPAPDADEADLLIFLPVIEIPKPGSISRYPAAITHHSSPSLLSAACDSPPRVRT